MIALYEPGNSPVKAFVVRQPASYISFWSCNIEYSVSVCLEEERKINTMQDGLIDKIPW